MSKCDNCGADLNNKMRLSLKVETSENSFLGASTPSGESTHHFCDLPCLQSWALGVNDSP